MKRLKGKTVLQHVIERVSQSALVDEIIVATTVSKKDDIIEQEALHLNAKVFRGSEDDVLGRYYHAAKQSGADIIVRITSDCPLIDPYVIDDTIRVYLSGGCDIATNAGLERTFPRGLDTEVFSFDVLKTAFLNAKEVYQREHVTPYIYEKASKMRYHKSDVDYSRFRWTLDTSDDYELISRVYAELYDGEHDFYLEDIIDLFDRVPGLYMINAHVEQKEAK